MPFLSLSSKFFQETENMVVMVFSTRKITFFSPYALFLESFRTVQKRQSKHFFKGALEVLEAEMLKELFEKVFRQMIHGVHKLYWNSLLATDAAAYSKASELKLRTMLLLLLLTSWQAYCKKPGTISQTIDGMNFGEICHVLKNILVLKLGGWNISFFSGIQGWPPWPLRSTRPINPIVLRCYWKSRYLAVSKNRT